MIFDYLNILKIIESLLESMQIIFIHSIPASLCFHIINWYNKIISSLYREYKIQQQTTQQYMVIIDSDS